MKTLCIDIGNSSAKAAIFEDGKFVGLCPVDTQADRVIVVSTSGKIPEIKNAVVLTHTTPVPIKNLYSTPETLGLDRLAAAVGAYTLYPGQTSLIVDFGTAITYDVVTAAGEFLGGNISPGATSRFRALKDYTAGLPLCELRENRVIFPSKTTSEAIENGVAMGIEAETEHYIDLARQRFGDINILFTGGDANYFAKRTKNPIFVVSDLIFYGLNAILEYNI